MATTATTYRCGCGTWLGEACEWVGPLSQMVVIEYMPPYLRESHRAAGNPGIWPHNGSIRVAVERSCANMLLAGEPDHYWAKIVEGANPANYVEEPVEVEAE